MHAVAYARPLVQSLHDIWGRANSAPRLRRQVYGGADFKLAGHQVQSWRSQSRPPGALVLGGVDLARQRLPYLDCASAVTSLCRAAGCAIARSIG
jgi:hypothetical protein